MAVTSITRFNGGSRDQFVAVAKTAKAIFAPTGGDFQVAQIYSGPNVGQWVAFIRYSNWEAYGTAMTALGSDPAYQKMMAALAAITQPTDRTFILDIDL